MSLLEPTMSFLWALFRLLYYPFTLFWVEEVKVFVSPILRLELLSTVFFIGSEEKLLVDLALKLVSETALGLILLLLLVFALKLGVRMLLGLGLLLMLLAAMILLLSLLDVETLLGIFFPASLEGSC
jgi:hypothetical protein